jgi:hypothetical protein
LEAASQTDGARFKFKLREVTPSLKYQTAEELDAARTNHVSRKGRRWPSSVTSCSSL